LLHGLRFGSAEAGGRAAAGRVLQRAHRLPPEGVAAMKPQPGQAGANGLPGLLQQVRACTICTAQLPLGPRPVLQLAASARILIAAQAPGRKVHESGLPFDDASGERLRQWLGINREAFYDARSIAILPMGFCFPGSGKSGDLPPRPECAAHWRAQLLASLPHIELTLVIGRYAQDWHLPGSRKSSLTDTVKAWREHWPRVLPLPHPSPRNNLWLSKNPWFALEVVPPLQARVACVLGLG
jgi:uracil-DNA glycosylase